MYCNHYIDIDKDFDVEKDLIDTVHAMLPDTLSTQHKDAYMKDLQSAMQKQQEAKTKRVPAKPAEIVIDSRTSGISLGRYAKRKDIIGDKARTEISRRKRNIKEETISGDGGIGGLGFNTGNPAIDPDELNSYVATNQLAKDQENGFLSKYLQDNQSKIAKKIGFKAFENAIALDIAMGGSTNTILHLLAIAQEAKINFTMADIDRMSKVVPQLCKVAPNTNKYHIEDVHRAGGVMAFD